MSKTAAATITGIVIAAITQSLALAIAGAGHGWTEPFFVSAATWIVFPMIFIRLRGWAQASGWLARLDWLTVAAAFVLDAYLLIATARDTSYFEKMLHFAPVPVLLWIALWLSWQIAGLAVLGRRRAKLPIASVSGSHLLAGDGEN